MYTEDKFLYSTGSLSRSGSDTLRRMPRIGVLIAIGFLALIFASTSASFLIDYEGWKEMGQLETWYAMAAYQYLPRLAVALLAFLAYRTAFGLGRRRARAMAEVIDIDEPGAEKKNPFHVGIGG